MDKRSPPDLLGGADVLITLDGGLQTEDGVVGFLRANATSTAAGAIITLALRDASTRNSLAILGSPALAGQTMMNCQKCSFESGDLVDFGVVQDYLDEVVGEERQRDSKRDD